jgi:hypothetical protein
MSGHDHLYQHNILNYGPGEQIHFLVGGGGGAPTRRVKSEEAHERCQQYYTAAGLDVDFFKYERIYHYYVIDIESDQLNINVVEVTGDPNNPTRSVEKIVVGSGDND